MESVHCSAPKRTYTLLAMYAAPMLFCLACYSNKLCISEQGTWLLHFCLTVPEPPVMATSCPEGCRPVRVCSFVLHLQDGVMLECHQSFYGLNFEWEKESNTDLVKAEVFLLSKQNQETFPVLRFLFTLIKSFQTQNQLATTHTFLLLSTPRKWQITIFTLLASIPARQVCFAQLN